MMGSVESLVAVCIAIGLPLGGVLVVLSSPRGAFLVLGLVTAATSVALFRVSPRRLAPVVADEAPTPVVGSDRPTPEHATAQTGVP
jgi:predicted MFS family arabinose efflux permease